MSSSGGGDFMQQLSGLASSLVTYLKTRNSEQWLFFAVGLIIGILIG